MTNAHEVRLAAAAPPVFESTPASSIAPQPEFSADQIGELQHVYGGIAQIYDHCAQVGGDYADDLRFYLRRLATTVLGRELANEHDKRPYALTALMLAGAFTTPMYARQAAGEAFKTGLFGDDDKRAISGTIDLTAVLRGAKKSWLMTAAQGLSIETQALRNAGEGRLSEILELGLQAYRIGVAMEDANLRQQQMDELLQLLHSPAEHSPGSQPA